MVYNFLNGGAGINSGGGGGGGGRIALTLASANTFTGSTSASVSRYSVFVTVKAEPVLPSTNLSAWAGKFAGRDGTDDGDDGRKTQLPGRDVHRDDTDLHRLA